MSGNSADITRQGKMLMRENTISFEEEAAGHRYAMLAYPIIESAEIFGGAIQEMF
jgi:hypothetical protein